MRDCLHAGPAKPNGVAPIRFLSEPRTDAEHGHFEWIVGYFDPARDANLPHWAFPPDINPVHHVAEFPTIEEFRALNEKQQDHWIKLGMVAMDSQPGLPAELARCKECNGSAIDQMLVHNEIVLRSIEAKAILERIKESFDQAASFWSGRFGGRS